MKVLLIDVNYKHSSTGKIVYDLHTYLQKNLHNSAVCYGRGPLIKEPNIYKFSSNIETYMHAFLTRITGLTGIYSPLATRKLIKYMNKFKPDIVHIHELHAYFVNIATVMNYLKKNNIKTIWTFHCEFMYTGKCGHAYDCDKWKSECSKCPQVKEYPSSWYFDFSKKMYKTKKNLYTDFDNLTIVTPSKWLADRVRQSFLKDKDIRIIYNGVDTKDIFFPRPFDDLKQKHDLKDEKIILAVAPNLMSESKGGRWVLELAKKFKKENVKFILIGIDDLTQQMDENVIALGRTIDQIELAKYYSMADVTLLTSMKETFSLVCAESISCGTPVIGFEAGAPSEIAPKGYGIFVPYGDIDSLSNILKSLLNNQEIMMSSDQCFNYGKQMYSNGNMLKAYIDLYMSSR